MDNSIFRDGEFFMGCNYWASHAGTNMWRDWRPDVVENDMKLLAKHNIRYMRMFPLWPDFQPIKMHRGGAGSEREIRMGEDPLPHTEAGRAGVSEVMCQRFGEFCDLAEKYGIKLVVGLITGWMSGRYYVPDLFEKVNVLTDARAIKWETKFVKYMVRRFKDHPAIAAWDLGNECNCLAWVSNSDDAYRWCSAITNAIKSEDQTHPVVSGMHSTFPEKEFRPQDLGEILDVLCTHPYPIFVPHCMTDPITENKSVLHATAETVMYRGISGKQAFVEEAGTLGPMISSEENAAAYVNAVLHLLWAHNCLGFMWWCGFEQTHLEHTPYDWCAVERELGLFHSDFSPKPVVKVMEDFANYTEAFEYKKMPDRIVDAVCIVPDRQESWLAAYGTFIMASQAGLDIEFCYIEDEIPEARAYIIPSYNHDQQNRHIFADIMNRVKKGAALYMSIGNALLSPFKDYFGLEPQYHYQPTHSDEVKFAGETYYFTPPFKIPYRAAGAEVMAYDGEGSPVMAKNQYGEGTVYFLTYPLENIVGDQPGVNSGENFKPYYKFYKAMDALRNPEKKVTKDNPHVALSEHIVDDEKRILVAVNCVPRESTVTLTMDGFQYSRTLKDQGIKLASDGNTVTLTMPGNTAIILEIAK